MDRTTNICNEAAKWWASKIEEESHKNTVHGLPEFEKQLSDQFREKLIHNGSFYVSTSQERGRGSLLYEIAFKTGMNAAIPSGIEMTANFGRCSIYSSDGTLMADF